ncbi:PD-(D/E)XK nuclease family protein [Epilithonimonas xixisoli]|uniref:PD-(D/E)XK nuclease superfamily protein n=1 Tax=Epilithonimonas xixisoli TaxID=1476462 RepID=A0A4V3H2Z0_9FLAO|nr:PD-(D/E)XK nuclease family protein [Epilithonimonas xixisoli]TDX86901.1 PD-(D/E)XK nuclease superfamily protein [Epilithonimonas xixisoli]
MQFLQRIISELLENHKDLSGLDIVLPGKRPMVFIKRILQEKQYQGLLPNFVTIDELIAELSEDLEVKGIALWLFAFRTYQKVDASEDFSGFLKWFPTLQKDWDDMMKFSENDQKILEWMLDEERIKNWGEDLGDDDNARKRNLNFWRKMNEFLPLLKSDLKKENLATAGMIYQEAFSKLENFAKSTQNHFVFCGFNALSRVEEQLVRKLLQWNKAETYFQADKYYIDDARQESGKFLRDTIKWKEFDLYRNFNWIDDQFSQPKSIKTYEVSGNIVQAKVLPEILKKIPKEELSETALVLLDENLLPAVLDSLTSVESVNITMGFPLKNLSFSNAIKKLFYLQKQQEKKSSSYYYADVLPILEELPNDEIDSAVIQEFIAKIEERNIVYISKNLLAELLGKLSYFQLLQKPESTQNFLDLLIKFCYELKFKELDDIQYENVAHFEKVFKVIKNQLLPYKIEIKIETLEVLINQLVNTESIDFVGEPLAGFQIMGLLETRLLNFKNIILLSVNEGKLPLGNTQNTYIPFDVRKNFGLNTFLENDSIYAYHFYRLIQNSENVHLLYNALSSGVNTGEKSRFITQLEMESPHQIEHIIIENTSETISQELMKIEKNEAVIQLLNEWKNRVSASHLVTYLYNPIDFYLNQILKTRETNEIEEELSQRNYGNLVHYALQFLHEPIKGKILSINDLEDLLQKVDESIEDAIDKLKHQSEFYERGMNFIHKEIAKRVVRNIVEYDLELVKNGSALEIIDLEKEINCDFYLDENRTDKISFYGFIDRIDRLDGVTRVIDYKTAKPKKLTVSLGKNKEEKLPELFFNDDYKQALQLSIYKYCITNSLNIKPENVETAIWSFAEVNNGPQNLNFIDIEDSEVEDSIRNLIAEILNPEVPFEEKEKVSW